MFKIPKLVSSTKRSLWWMLGAALTLNTAAIAQDTSSWQSVTEEMELGASIDYNGVQLFPIRSASSDGVKLDVLTLREGLNLGVVSVVEQGEGNVAQLTVVNSGQKPVLLAVGDVVEGGRQDRVIVSDLLVPPNKQPTPVAVHCVERGRWTQGAQRVAFNYGGRGESGLKKVLQMESNQQATWGAVASLNQTKGSQIQRLAARNEPSHAQEMLSDAPLHSQVFAELQPPTETYMASLSSAAVETHLTDYTEAMAPLLEEAGLIGVVVAVDGELVAAEAYGDPRLFRSSARDIIRSVGLDALSVGAGSDPSHQVSPTQAAEFLGTALSETALSRVSSTTGIHTQKRSESASSYELHDSNGGLLHLNVYAH